jgi:hypothetical protein
MSEAQADALNALIDGTRSDIVRILNGITDNRVSSIASLRGYRVSSLTITGTILAPVSLAVAALFPTIEIGAIIALLIFVGLTGVLIVGFTGRMVVIQKELTKIQENFHQLELSLSTVATAYRSEVAKTGLGDGKIVTDFYDLWLVTNSAIYFQISTTAKKYLDTPTRDAVSAIIRFMCDKTITSWDVLKSDRATRLFSTNGFLKKIIDDYVSYCNSNGINA